MTSRTPPTNCLFCGRLATGATNAGENHSKPTPGSISICIHCGAVSAFGDDLQLRPLTEKEIAEITGNKNTMAFLAMVTKAVHFIKAAQN